jgi:(p)ppGpp synthase/HD superfamily hydrolase
MVKVRERKYFLGSIQSEKLIRLNGLKKVDPHSNQLYSMACKFLNKYQKIKIDKAYSFAKKIKYKHGNMSPEIYFAHPKRVSALSMLLYDNNNIDAAILGLIHNVFELTSRDEKEISLLFGSKISKQAFVLTVDRQFQWDRDYKKEYYEKISSGPIESSVIKVLDKVDNLFILGTNPDSEIKYRYLKEIEDYIVPMTSKSIPSLSNYLERLIEYNYKNSF